MSGLEILLTSPLLSRLGWTLAAFLWQGSLVAALLFCINGLARRSSPHARYAAACAALMWMAALPVVTFLGEAASPRPMASSDSEAGILAQSSAPVSPAPIDDPRPASSLVRAARGAASWLAPRLVPVWTIGVLLLSIRLLGGWASARSLSRIGVSEPPAALAEMLARTARKLRLSRPVRLLQSAALAAPASLGVVKPVVLVPMWVFTGLTPEELEAVLAHELAHIRRHDYLVNLLQTVVETLLFYHPAVWWVSRRIRVERENCCDDLAVAATGDARAYARALMGLEETRRAPTGLAVAASGGTLWRRIERLLTARPSPGGGASRWLAAALAMATVGALATAVRVSAAGVASTRMVGVRGGVEGGIETGVAGGVPGGVEAGVRGGTADGVSGGIRGGTSGGVRGGVEEGVAGEVRDDTDEEPAEESSEQAKAGPGHLSTEDIADLRRHGVTAEMLGSLSALGYKKESVHDLVSLSIHGVTPEFISAMNAAFGKRSIETLVALRIHGVTADYVRGFREAGYEGMSSDQALALRIHGASPEAAAEWGRVLSRRPSLDEILSAQIHGATPEFGREMRSLGCNGDIDAYIAMRIHGVTPDFFRALRSLELPNLSADQAVSARIHGVDPDFVRGIRSLGYTNASFDELVALRIHGVTPDFIRESNGPRSRLSIDELLDIRIHGRKK